MTPQQIKDTRIMLGQSEREFARHLGYMGKDAARRVRRLEKGTLQPSKRVKEIIASSWAPGRA